MSDEDSSKPEVDLSGIDIGDAAGEATSPTFVVLGQYTKDLSFENPAAPESLINPEQAPEVDISVKVDAQPAADNNYEVVLHITAEAKHKERTVFLVELAYGGVFSISGVPQEHIQPLLLIEGPRLLFPFARNIVAEATREGGFPPLLIQPIDFANMYQEHAASAQAAAGNAQTPAEGA